MSREQVRLNCMTRGGEMEMVLQYFSKLEVGKSI